MRSGPRNAHLAAEPAVHLQGALDVPAGAGTTHHLDVTGHLGASSAESAGSDGRQNKESSIGSRPPLLHFSGGRLSVTGGAAAGAFASHLRAALRVDSRADESRNCLPGDSRRRVPRAAGDSGLAQFAAVQREVTRAAGPAAVALAHTAEEQGTPPGLADKVPISEAAFSGEATGVVSTRPGGARVLFLGEMAGQMGCLAAGGVRIRMVLFCGDAAGDTCGEADGDLRIWMEEADGRTVERTCLVTAGGVLICIDGTWEGGEATV